MEEEGLFTTVTGSMPMSNTEENMIRAFEDIINIGIDFPCYPQLIPMNSQFLSPLSKIIDQLNETKPDTFYLEDDFQIPDKLVALEYGEFMINFLNERPELKNRIKGTKACLTGPFTMASEIFLGERLAKGVDLKIFNEHRAIMVDWIVDKIADIMKEIGKAYNNMGINIITMDDPILSLLVGKKIFFHSEDFIIKTINKALSGIKNLSSIHICGRISPRLRDIILQTDVKIMDHEFRTCESNFNIFKKKHLEDYNKYLAMGTLQSNIIPMKHTSVNDYVETIDFLIKYINKGIEKYGKKNLFLKSDCGFGALKDSFENEEFAYEITIRKLNNLVLAVKSLR